MKLFLVTNFRIDTADNVPGELVLDDLADVARDASTVVETDPVIAKKKMKEKQGRFLYSVTVERN